MLALAAILAAPTVLAASNAQLKSIKKTISSVPVPELPATAADLVTKASREDREIVAITALKAAIFKSRSSTPLVVAAISKAAPDVAAPVARVAAQLESAQSASITAAAVDAAPHAKAEIISSVQQGVSASAASSSVPTVADASEANRELTVRGEARTVNGGHANNKNKPINRGNGRFPISPPHGGLPPGHDPNHQGRPDFVDYTQPRRF